MNSRKVENGLALLGVLIVLFGVSSAANTAFASEADAVGTSLKIAVSPTD
jgi:hypothetical protein